MTNKLLTQVLVETYGQDYLDLIVKDKQVHEQHIRGQKIEFIKRIAVVRKNMGYPQMVATMFDYLYDKDLHTIRLIALEYEELLKEH